MEITEAQEAELSRTISSPIMAMFLEYTEAMILQESRGLLMDSSEQANLHRARLQGKLELINTLQSQQE